MMHDRYCDNEHVQHRSFDVSDYPDDELLRRAVLSARCAFNRGRHPRYTAVMWTFGLGSTYAKQLCRRFGLDPEEVVR